MVELTEEVKDLVKFEYQRAAAKFGFVNHSDHESYAILLEEKEEADSECEGVGVALECLWAMIKENAPDDQKLRVFATLENRAILAACELIQVAAMASKATITIRSRSEDGENQ